MVHLPINHHLQPLYRVIAVGCGLYVLIFGIAGTVESHGLGAFAREGLPAVLGLKANLAFSVLSIVMGAVIVSGGFLGRNIDRWTNLIAGIIFTIAGMAMMIVMQTTLNVLAFTVTTCVVSFVLGIVLAVAGLYGKVGTEADIRAEEAFRHGGHLEATAERPNP